MAGSCGKVNRQPARFIAVVNFAWRAGQGNEDPRMVSFPEALELLLEHTPLLSVERCRLEDASGRVLRANVAADRPFPAFDRVMMDGHALRLADWQAGHRSFRVTGSAPAGQPAPALTAETGTCVEVMTGAPCPAGADCIVPVEEVSSAAGCVKFSGSCRSSRGPLHPPRGQRCGGG